MPITAWTQDSTFPAFPPADVTNQMDRDQMLWQLGIELPSLPPRLADPNRPADAKPVNENNTEGNWTNRYKHTIARSPFGSWNNYSDRADGFFPGPDSAKLGNYVPAEILRSNSGMAINTPEQWWDVRRPEILSDLQQYLYGKIPNDSILPAIKWNVQITLAGRGSGAYVQKVITGTLDVSRYPTVRDKPVISAVLRTPQNATGEVPVIIFFSSQGNLVDFYWERSHPEGWGVCIFNHSLLQPDNGTGLTSYLIGLVNKGNWRKPDDWGTLGAWSWGVSRLIDYLETDKHVNKKAVGLAGHSRYGKATLLAMAYDTRIAVGFPSDAGSLGTKMNRRHWGQDLEHSTGPNEYHWMAGNFFRLAGEKYPGQYLPRKIDDCPVDAHSLLSLCAPRPIFINGGTNSSWSDPYGMYLTAKYATPAYELLGTKGIVMNDAKPLIDTAYIEGNIAYRYHNGGHTDIPDWPSFFKFAAKHFEPQVLDVSASSLVFDATDGLEAKIRISSSGEAQIVPSDYWIGVSLDERTDSLTVTVAENKFTSGNIYPVSSGWAARSGFITITTSGRVQIVYVYQGSAKPVVDLPVTEIWVGDRDGSLGVFDIFSNSAWTLSSDEGWVSFSEEAGTGDKRIQVTASANPRASQRMATIKLRSPGFEHVFLISVIQARASPYVNVSANKVSMDPSGGATVISINANTPWDITVIGDWLNLSAKTGDGSRQISLNAGSNPGKTRSARITIIANGVPAKVVEVVQEGEIN